MLQKDQCILIYTTYTEELPQARYNVLMYRDRI